MASSQFPVIRGPDAQQSRVQDNISVLVTPVVKAVQNTPIMGAPPPAWQYPDFLNAWHQSAATQTDDGTFMAYHRDALGYVHLKGFGGRGGSASAPAPGVYTGLPIFILPPGNRPGGARIFPVFGANSWAFLVVETTGIVRVLSAYGAVNPEVLLSLDGVTFLAEQ